MMNRLFSSFEELEGAIHSAREILLQKDNPPSDILKRIDQYEQILSKQKDLAVVLCGHISLGNWGEVTRHLKLINALSEMIRDDAREVIAPEQASEVKTDRLALAC